MFPFASIRPRLAEWGGWLPAAALPIAMFAALLALGGDRGFFYRAEGDHDWGTVKNMAVVENMSPAHNFLLTTRVWRDDDGAPHYAPYGRFPVGGYVLLKLATLPFGGDLAAKLMAARVLMLLMFCGAAALAFLAMSRATGSRWIALAATLLAFSGFYALYHADHVSNESVMDLFGAGLALHGMAVFVQEGRFRQLLVKTCAALLLGWHVYALLLPFIVLGFGGAALALLRSAAASDEKAKAARAAIISLVRSRCAALAAVSILFGAALLAFNFASEYINEGGGGRKTPLELESVNSALRRFGVNSPVSGHPDLQWDRFAMRQLYRAGVASVPYAAARAVGWEFRGLEPSDVALAPAVWGLAATGAALGALAFARRRRRLLMASAVLFGFCWAIPMRYNTFPALHTFEGVHYLWLALALFALALVGARRLLGGRAAIAAAAIAAPIFALSVFYAGQLTEGAHEAERQRAEMADFDVIREMTRGKTVGVFPDDGPWFAPMEYYLAGIERMGVLGGVCEQDRADFVVNRSRAEIPSLLTTDNRFAFLYENPARAELCEAKRRRIESSEPSARSAWDVYVQDGEIDYMKAPCEPSDYDAPFFAYVRPVNPDDMPARFQKDGFHTLRVRENAIFEHRGACFMTLELPAYPIAVVHTGQMVLGVERLWEVFINPPPNAEARARYERAYQAIAASGDPAARSGFDLYFDLDRNTLSYLKAPCGADDARGRFFLSVHPTDVADLPADRRAHGHESLNFNFAPPAAAIFDGKCMATRPLPDYKIAFIQTGQWTPDGERLWEAAASPPLDDEARSFHENAYRAITAYGAPAARSEFDLHLYGDTLFYLKESCGESDTRGRFFLSVHPVDVDDLPAERRDLGHESVIFEFVPSAGVIFDGKCMATRRMPDYPIAFIQTGRDAPDGERLWEVAISPPLDDEALAFYERAYQAIAESGEPAARSGFDLYLDSDGDTLSYLKAPCGANDARGRFFLSVHPVDVADLPESRRALGHESLNFDFAPPAGIVFGDKCMTTRQLPDYPIAIIETGQETPGGERLWDAAVNPPPNAEARAFYEKAYQAIASSGPPAARSGFDLYLDSDGGTLSYLKAPCGADDARGRFFLSVHPVDVADLPENLRALGHESLNFDFAPPAGIVFGDKCMTTRPLPAYPIDRIATGQDAPGGERLWDAEIVISD